MNFNLLSTAALLAIAVALFIQVGVMWDPTSTRNPFQGHHEVLPEVAHC